MTKFDELFIKTMAQEVQSNLPKLSKEESLAEMKRMADKTKDQVIGLHIVKVVKS